MLASPSVLSQEDDVDAAADDTALFLAKLNATAASNQQILASDILFTPGRVEDVTAPITSATFTSYDPAHPNAMRINTLAIEASRPANGANPLYLLVRSALTPQAANIGSVSYATLDSRLIGLQPTETVNTPVAPIGILYSAWVAPQGNSQIEGGPGHSDFGHGQGNSQIVNNNGNSSQNSAGNGNSDFGHSQGRKKFRGTISGAAASNLLLLDFHQNGSIAIDGGFADRIKYGLDQTDIEIVHADPSTPDYFLGPVIEGSPTVKIADIPAQATLNAGDELLLFQALGSIEGEKRIFPLCSSITGAGKTNIVGFAGATVKDVQYIDGKLQLDLEPEFIVHFTAVTAYQFNDGENTITVPENVYIHKLRLSR
jgi:hypothetical protein